jgi:hypothetical protein
VHTFLQVAFAEGYHAKEKSDVESKNTFTSKMLRFVFYLCLFWLALQVIQVFTGSMVGGGQYSTFSISVHRILVVKECTVKPVNSNPVK